jgi:magnesium transporter
MRRFSSIVLGRGRASSVLGSQIVKIFRKRHPAVGARPGTLVVPVDATPPRIRVVHYDTAGFSETPVDDPAALKPMLGRPGVTWIDVQGIGNEKIIRSLGEIFEIHALALEDVVNTPQRPAIDAYPTHQLLITRTYRLEKRAELAFEQISIFVGKDYVLSFQERPGPELDPVRVRVREGKGPIREAGADYLAYALLDTIVDGYYPVIESVSELLVALEGRIMARPTPGALERLNRIKLVLAALNRGILPQREALNRLLRDSTTSFFSTNVRVYLRDTLDHCAQLADIVDTNRDLANNLLNTYLSLVSVRTNDVMKVLTIMATIFIPLSFLTSLYGMNFEMPEIHWAYGYPAVLFVMAICVVWMLFYFRRKGWLGQGDDDADDQE